MFRKYYLLMKPDDATQGGGAPPAVDHAKEIAALKTQNAELLKKIEAANKPELKPDDELHQKAALQKEAENKKHQDTRELESAVKFGYDAPNFLKNNEALLPKNAADIFKAAESEKYDSAIEKVSALKSSLIQSFFEVQSNLDQLTPAQKNQVDEYMKLTKNVKQERANVIYDNIFEPTLEKLRAIRKAENLSKGYSSGDSVEDAYKNKMITGAKKHYLGEKT